MIGIHETGLIESKRGLATYYDVCFARQKNFVALFDFASFTEKEIKDIHSSTWRAHFPVRHGRFSIALQISREILGDDYVPSSQFQFPSLVSIPYVESWSKSPIPIGYVQGGFVFDSLNATNSRLFDSRHDLLEYWSKLSNEDI